MLKLITDVNNPDSVREFTLEQLFNPLVNPVQLRKYTGPEILTWLKSLYTRDNIINNPKLFFPSVYQYNHPISDADIATFIAPIPDDKLWTLNFLSVLYLTSNNRPNIPRFIPYVPHSSNRQNQFAECYLYDEEVVASSQSYNSTHWAAFILPHIDNMVEKWTPIFTDFRQYAYFQSAVPFTRTFFHFIFGVEYAYDDHNTYNAQNLYNLMSRDPNISLFIEPCLDFTVRIKKLITKLNKSPLYQVMNYSASPTALLFWPLTAKGEHNPILYGIELECSSDYTCQQLVDATDEPFFLIKSDSSVTGNKRWKYELATVPMSMKAHRKQWAYWFSKLDYNAFDCTNDTNNGLHVHIDKKAFSNPVHIRNFTWFFTHPAHTEFMIAVSDRNRTSFNQYSAVPLYDRHKIRSYIKCNEIVQHIRGCVYFSNKNTIEVRLFRGIVSLAEVLKNLEFVDAVFHFTLQANIQTLSLAHFMTWMEKTPKNKYVILKKFFAQIRDLQSYITQSQLFDIIFNETNPVKIINLRRNDNIESRMNTLLFSTNVGKNVSSS